MAPKISFFLFAVTLLTLVPSVEAHSGAKIYKLRYLGGTGGMDGREVRFRVV